MKIHRQRIINKMEDKSQYIFEYGAVGDFVKIEDVIEILKTYIPKDVMETKED